MCIRDRLLTSPLFGISLLNLGLPLAFLFLSLYIFGITLGLIVSAGLLRFGPSFENIAWSTMFLLAPFGCIYYPVETLPIFFQAEDGIRDLVRSRGLGDVYKRQITYNKQHHVTVVTL